MTIPAGTSRRADSATWPRRGAAAGVAGMASWVAGVALIPLQARLEHGDGPLADLLAENSARLYLAASLATAGGVLLVALFAVLVHLVPDGHAGAGLLRVALAGCIVTQTMVGVGAGFGLVGIHSAVAGAPAELVAFAWRGLWLMFLASGVPTLPFTVTGVLGLRAAGRSRAWVSALGWLSALAHLVILATVAQAGALAPDGVVGAIVPVTTVLWILGVSFLLLRRGPGDIAASGTTRRGVAHPAGAASG